MVALLASGTVRAGTLDLALTEITEWKAVYVDFSGRLQRAQIDNY